MRKKIIVANWKMNLSFKDAEDLVSQLKTQISKVPNVDVAVCPSFVYLPQIINILKGSQIQVGAQNMYFKDEGAYTGEIAPGMLKDIGIRMVIIGHSERRQIFKETDEEINLKVKAALKFGFIPILCIGEDLETREKGEAEKWVNKQFLAATRDLTSVDLEKLIIAYEPIWAIGTGKICSGEDAVKINKSLRKTITEKFSLALSEKIRMLYGGSIKSSNFSEHIKHNDINGGLVGGASLKADEFLKIIELASMAPVKA